MAPPILKHLYLDNFWLDLGNAIDSIHYFDNVVIEHMHPLLEKSSADNTYFESWATVDHDKAMYEKYKDLDFLNDVNKVKGIYENFDNGS